MNNLLSEIPCFGMLLSLAAFGIGVLIQSHCKNALLRALMSPFLIAVILVITVLILFKIDYETYSASGDFLTFLLTPTTVCLAIPLYQNLRLLKRNWRAILIGIGTGILANLAGILSFSILFGFTHEQYVTLLPKSVTTAIGIGLSEELGGIVAISVAVICITGITGNVFGPMICHLFRIKNPVAKGVAMGSAAHAIGTAKAMEMGEQEGAMSGLAIAVAGLLTVIAASVFASFY